MKKQKITKEEKNTEKSIEQKGTKKAKKKKMDSCLRRNDKTQMNANK